MQTYNYQPEKIKAIHSIMQLAYEINCHTPFCVFVNYHGHTDQLDLHIGKGKTNHDFTELLSGRKTLYLEERLTPSTRWAEVIANLQNILEKYRTLPTKLEL